MSRIRWTETAQSDLRAIHTLLARDSPRYARRAVDRIRESTDRLDLNPYAGDKAPECDRDDVREMLVGPYRVIYRAQRRQVRILTVVHAACEPAEPPDAA
jgi:toxin ParE1/3/4